MGVSRTQSRSPQEGDPLGQLRPQTTHSADKAGGLVEALYAGERMATAHRDERRKQSQLLEIKLVARVSFTVEPIAVIRRIHHHRTVRRKPISKSVGSGK